MEVIFVTYPVCTGTYSGASLGSGLYGGWFNYNYGNGSVGQVLKTLGFTGSEIIDPTGATTGNETYMINSSKDNYTIWATISKPSSLDSNTINSCYFSSYDNYLGAPNHNYCISN